MNDDLIAKHYSDERVRNEVAKFAKDRWVGVHCEVRDKKGRQILRRYKGRFRKPIIINEPKDVERLLYEFKRFKPRTFYATINLYKRTEHFEDVYDFNNIMGCTPTWDIDNILEDWEATILVAKEILSFLEGFGIRNSVFIKWSGNGCHIHLHHKSISQDILRKVNPLDVAYSIVEFVITRLKERLTEIRMKSRDLAIENKIDVQRLFTCPLSLHRELNMVCICIDKSKLESFGPEWAEPDNFVHYYGWDSYEVGEADELAEKAYLTIGPCPYYGRRRRPRRYPSIDEQILRYLP